MKSDTLKLDDNAIRIIDSKDVVHAVIAGNRSRHTRSRQTGSRMCCGDQLNPPQ